MQSPHSLYTQGVWEVAWDTLFILINNSVQLLTCQFINGNIIARELGQLGSKQSVKRNLSTIPSRTQALILDAGCWMLPLHWLPQSLSGHIIVSQSTCMHSIFFKVKFYSIAHASLEFILSASASQGLVLQVCPPCPATPIFFYYRSTPPGVSHLHHFIFIFQILSDIYWEYW